MQHWGTISTLPTAPAIAVFSGLKISCGKPREIFAVTQQSATPTAAETFTAKNHGLRARCEDYGDCIHARHFWGQSIASKAETRVNEYRTLVEELEIEIVEALAAADSVK